VILLNKCALKFIGIVEEIEEDISRIRIFPEFREGLKGLESFSHLIVLFWFHLRDDCENRTVIRVIPKRHPRAPEMGVFATRSPSRPNPVGLCVVKLVEVGNSVLFVKDLDAFKNSPILDIKPYLPKAESIADAITPEWIQRGPKT
jgi:tRNA-Thr(GGU) m(6)t(6)A37 methyltransferase TsaA